MGLRMQGVWVKTLGQARDLKIAIWRRMDMPATGAGAARERTVEGFEYCWKLYFDVFEVKIGLV